MKQFVRHSNLITACLVLPLAALTMVTTAAARGSDSSFAKPIVVQLGVHRFGHTRSPDAVVARARADQVGWLHEGVNAGPETFLVGRDRSIWLHDELNHRLLVWRAGNPNAVAMTVTLPFANAEDVALGPANTLYFEREVAELKEFHLYRMSVATGEVLWQSKLGPEAGGNTPLRVGPDGRLYALVAPNMRWMPVATADGRPLPIAAQEAGIRYQPLRGGLRLVPRVVSPHELRVSLIGGSGKPTRVWRIFSRTAINFTGFYTPALVGGDPVIVLDATAGKPGRNWKWEYEVLRLTPRGATAHFSLRHAIYGEDLFADLRIGPDGKLYQLATSPTTGARIFRYSIGGRGETPTVGARRLARAAVARTPACATSGLDVWIDTQGNGAAGSVYYKLMFTNLSGHACTLVGYPGVSAVDLRGHRLGRAASREPSPRRLVSLGKGRSATATLRIVQAANFPGSTCHKTTAAGLRVYPPNQRTSRLVPFPFDACSRAGPVYLMIRPVG